jgi:predicted  nucleic acid-binding Zn-ribbon protein
LTAIARSLTTLLLIALAILAIAACGDDDGETQAFEDDFPALSERIASLGSEVGNTIETAENASDDELAREFDDFAQQVEDLRQDLEDLEPPEDLADERDDLVSAMDGVRTSLESIASAAEDGDPEAAREATLELLDNSNELRAARQALAGAVRESD